MIDYVYSHDGLHPQDKKGHHWSVIQSERKLISDKRTLSSFSVCVQLSISLTLTDYLLIWLCEWYRRLKIRNATLSHDKGDIYRVFSVVYKFGIIEDQTVWLSDTISIPCPRNLSSMPVRQWLTWEVNHAKKCDQIWDKTKIHSGQFSATGG